MINKVKKIKGKFLNFCIVLYLIQHNNHASNTAYRKLIQRKIFTMWSWNNQLTANYEIIQNKIFKSLQVAMNITIKMEK